MAFNMIEIDKISGQKENKPGKDDKEKPSPEKNPERSSGNIKCTQGNDKKSKYDGKIESETV